MNDIQELIKEARARYKLASAEMDRLTTGSPGTNWRWSIPANPSRDTDLILDASVEDVPKLVAALEALNRENEELAARIEGFATWGTAAKESSGELWDIWSFADEEDARDAKRQFDDEPDEVGSDPVVIVKRYGNGPWVEVSS